MKLSSYISKAANNSLVSSLLESIETELEISKKVLETIKDNSLIISCDESTIEKWEEFFNITYPSDWTLQDRLEQVLYTKNGRGTFTIASLKEQANIFTNADIDVEELYDEYHFIIHFTSVIGVPSNLDNFKNMVNVNKPAHLTYEIVFRYRTHNELRSYQHQHLHKFTHNELRERGEL
jgi:stress response protein YsnF